ATYKLRTKEPFDISVSSTEYQEEYITGDIIIHGYAGSTAQEYAEKYNRKFEAITPSGDANGDGNFNISDIVTAQKMFLGNSNYKIKDWKSLDLDNNNKLDSFDLCLLKKKLLKSHK
ncbi:MAG: dockerin type I repeat-containing protein, partial [Ruminococcus sp.]|nr:dockerin type I repeat-containing protein [Ruminococcus sp.]